MSVQEVLKSYWPIITTVAAGILGYGTLNADVSNLKVQLGSTQTELKEAQKESRADHDLLVELNTRSQGMEDDMKEIKTAVKEIAKGARQ